MLDFFRTQRFVFQGADWLLFQYGTYDWGNGRYFDFNITRQLAVEIDYDDTDEDEDEDEGEGMWQLSLTFRFTPTAELDALRSDNRWCESHEPNSVSAFQGFIRSSAAYLAVADQRAAKVEMDYEDAG
jgi:hypothetical protein